MNAQARQRSSWLSVLAAVAGTAALSLFSVGCPEPADLDNPEIYPKRGGDTGASGSATGGSSSATAGSATGGSATGGGNLAACETACMADILVTCTACHSSAFKLGMLDLSPGYTARLKDQPATHSEVVSPADCPSGDKLINSAAPDESWLLKKVSAAQGTCGGPMPAPSGLAGAELQCMKDYVSCVAMGGT
ncbi:MAG: hypothetical protein K0R38_1541 [Polyangiaceae bacterium]|jgi:hypothetical protein|nr:hypothetical protein [Polyangiaceae bacterium]